MISRDSKLRLILSVILISIGSFVQAQIYLQIETTNEPQTIKYSPGDYIWLKTEKHQDHWISQRIERIMPEDNVILFEEMMLKPDQIVAVRRQRGFGRYAGFMLQQFGLIWTGYGVALDLFGRNDFDGRQAVIGGVAFGGGWLVRKLFSYKNYKMGRNHRMRIIDLRFIVD